MGWQAKRDDAVVGTEFHEGWGDVAGMAVEDKKAMFADSVGCCVVVEVLEPIQGNAAVGPAIGTDLDDDVAVVDVVREPRLLNLLAFEDDKRGYNVSRG